MTIEEGIESLEFLRIFDAPSLSEAVDMAVAALRAQQEAEKNEPTPSGWISVKERLPDVDKTDSDYESVRVLVAYNGTVMPLIYERAEIRKKTVYRWRSMFDRIFENESKITHWMPLPEPPKENDNEDDES